MRILSLLCLIAGVFASSTGQEIELDRDLVANYLFSGNAQDASGYDNHGTLFGPELTSDRNGNANSAYRFDGIDDYIAIPDADILSFPEQEFSIAMWIEPSPTKHSFTLYKGSNRNNREYAMGIRQDLFASIHINHLGSADNQEGSYSTRALEKDSWYHVVGTWNGSELSIYINGKLEDRKNYNITIGNYNSQLYLGSYGGDIGLYAYQGIIDDIFIYRRVINECEIEALYSGLLTEER